MAAANQNKKMDLTELADELLEQIFCCRLLAFKDILNLSLVCRRLYDVTRSNELWKIKLSQRWPDWSATLGEVQYLRAIQFRYHVNLVLENMLENIAKYTYTLDGIPNRMLNRLDSNLVDDNYVNMALDCLQCHTQQSPLTGDLNMKYHAEKVYRYVYHYKLKYQLMKLLVSEEKSIYSLEEGATIISQWCNPEEKIKLSEITKTLDDIAEAVKKILPSRSQSQPNSYRYVTEVLKSLNKILYDEYLFEGNSSSYYNISNSYIHQVLTTKKGIPLTLSILYIAIGRRLGLQIFGVNFPGHFLVKVNADKNGQTSEIYVDAFNGGGLLNQGECVTKFMHNFADPPVDRLFQVADERHIFIRMIANIINILRKPTNHDSRNMDILQSMLELMLLLSPHDDGHKLLLSRIYLHRRINLTEVIKRLQEMSSSERGLPMETLDVLLKHAEAKMKENRTFKAKYRSDEENSHVKYRVGMVMKHKLYHYYFVIFGWDACCMMDVAWQQQMGVPNLVDKDKQPYYNVLAHDGSSRYAAQENVLPISTSRPVQHREVGKHFKSFNGYHYIATPMLAEQYPEDQPIPSEQFPKYSFVETCE